MTRTEYPAVLIHGVFGYGRKRPFWNRGVPYWPERALTQMEANYLVVDVGVLSSDHDRACEAFYQLYGGRVDYGEAHAMRFGHGRFGETFNEPMHAHWSDQNPVHLVGHSVGATTAIELYQLICQDYFRVGSNYKWVRSIVSIAGPLSGTTLTHFFGLHDAKLVACTLGHWIGASLCLWHRLQAHFPELKNVVDYRMPQWEFVTSYREILSSRNRILASPDLAVYDILPARRRVRNQQLRLMDKPFLVSIVTSSTSKVPVAEISTALVIAFLAFSSLMAWSVVDFVELALVCGLAAFGLWLWLRKRLFLPMMQWRMRRCVDKLHEIFDGFDRSEWEHNDGAVNICSMHYPQLAPTPATSASTKTNDSALDSDSDVSTASSTSSSETVASPPTRPLKFNRHGLFEPELRLRGATKRTNTKFEPGYWYVHQVQGNHKAGTSFDRESPKLYHQLLSLIANEFEN